MVFSIGLVNQSVVNFATSSFTEYRRLPAGSTRCLLFKCLPQNSSQWVAILVSAPRKRNSFRAGKLLKHCWGLYTYPASDVEHMMNRISTTRGSMKSWISNFSHIQCSSREGVLIFGFLTQSSSHVGLCGNQAAFA